MGSHTAFFYGTLMAPPVLFRVIYGSSKPEEWQAKLTTVNSAILHNYERHRVNYAEYPAIIPREGTSVRGSYVTGLTEGDLWRLDIFEGSQYKRVKVKVNILKDVKLDEAAPQSHQAQQGDDGEEVEAETYIWTARKDELEAEEWDFEEFKAEKMKYWAGMSDDDEDSDPATSNGIVVDEGFQDVDDAVARMIENDRAQEDGWKAQSNGNVEANGHAKKSHDPMGGRGVNGDIGRQLKEAQQLELGLRD